MPQPSNLRNGRDGFVSSSGGAADCCSGRRFSGSSALSMWPPPVRFYISTFSAVKVSWTFFAGLGAGLMLNFALTIAAFWLNLGAPTVASRWAADINQKKRLLADRVAAPKLLLVGG